MFTAFLEWLFETVNKSISGFATMVLTTIGSDLTLIDQNFPVFQIYSDTVITLGIGFAFLIAVINVIKSIAAPVVDEDLESPVTILLRTLGTIILVYFSIDIMKTGLQFITIMQDMILNTTAAATHKVYPTLDFASMLGGFVAVTSGAFILLSLIMLAIFAYNYLIVVIQLLQRYIILGVLTYASPLAMATGASKTTSGIFSAFVRMYVGQFVLLLLSTWGIEIMMYTASNMSAGFLQYLLLLLFAKTITQFEMMLNKLNINVTPTARSFLGELLILRPLMTGAARGISGAVSAFSNKNSTASSAKTSGTLLKGNIGGRGNDQSKYDANGNTSKPVYDSKVVQTAQGFRLSKNSVDSTGQYKATKSQVMAGAIGRDLDGNKRNLVTGTGGAGVFSNLTDSRQRSQETSAVIADRMAQTADINSSIERVNNAMGMVATSISGHELSKSLNMKESNPNIELTGAFTHSGLNDNYLTGYASITGPRGQTRDELVAVSLNGADGLPGFFDTTTYTKIGDTGVRIYSVMTPRDMKAAEVEEQYKATREEATEINQKFEQDQQYEREHEQPK